MPSALLIVLNVLLMLWPSALTTETQATIINASMTAYSTAAGPSSEIRNREIDRRERDTFLFSEKKGE